MTDRITAAQEAAHDAYHEHNELCGCRTVQHLTAWIAVAVLAVEDQRNQSTQTTPSHGG